MIKYEYKVIYHNMDDLGPLASQERQDKQGRRGLEKSLNELADEGWEIVSCTTAATGAFLYFSPKATIILRREKT
jgi:Domain of unknown function (DUF4177)